MRENPQLVTLVDAVDPDEVTNADAESTSPSRASTPNAPSRVPTVPNAGPKKSHKRKASEHQQGPSKRSRLEKDFWDRVEVWFDEKVLQWGDGFGTTGWQQ